MDGGYVDPDGRDYGLPDGTVVRLYGGLAFRYWVGEPGCSDLISGNCQFWEPVRQEDQAEFEAGLKAQVRVRVARALSEKVGLLVKPTAPALGERIEWLVIWRAEPDTLDRLHAYEGGWSAARPPGVPADKLTAELIGRMVRRSGLTRRGR